MLGMSGIVMNAQEVTIAPGGYITVKENGVLYIGMDLLIQSVPDSSGYFVDHSSVGGLTVTGDITVERYMTADVWHNMASPVSNESSNCFTGTDLVFYYDETLILNAWEFGWVWYSGATGGPLMVFRGYDVYFDTIPVTVNYYATGTETLNTGPYTISVINTNSTPGEIPSHKGWSLLGNPYPSPVDWLASTGWDKSDINDAKYIWDGTNDIYTIFIGGGAPIGINGGTRFIPSSQGFWIQAIQTGSIGINNAVRLGDITGTPDFYKVEPIDYPMVSLVASGNDFSDEIIIRFLDGTTEGFDVNKDASKLFSFIEDVPQISIKAGNQILAINTLPELKDNLEVLLNFQCGKAGYYKISLTKRTNLDLNTKVYLKDELEQTIINLTADSVYGFYHKPANDINRFKIYFNPSADVLNNITPESYFTVYVEKNIITILKNTVQHVSGEIAIYNMLGQPVCREILVNEDKSSIRVNLPTGYYIVSIITNQHVSNSKILISN
ncbi:MAG: T9SS type A sorting domain-containing protein [Bacteroidales bacterium]|nr:T9SS type A sorting domain-containing protein [Bacteroidales bacterium]